MNFFQMVFKTLNFVFKAILNILEILYVKLLRPIHKIITRNVTETCEIERMMLLNNIRGLGNKI